MLAELHSACGDTMMAKTGSPRRCCPREGHRAQGTGPRFLSPWSPRHWHCGAGAHPVRRNAPLGISGGRRRDCGGVLRSQLPGGRSAATRDRGCVSGSGCLSAACIRRSGAHHADRFFMPARTDPDAPKHSGITFELAEQSLRLFAKEVLPVVKSW